MSDLNEAFDRLFVERVEISLTVIPRVRAAYFEIGIPLCALGRVVLADAPVALQISVGIEHYVIAGKQFAVLGAHSARCGVVREARRAVIGSDGKEQVTSAETLIFCYYSAGGAGRPSVLVIEPSKHFFALRLVGAGADEMHELVAQIFRIHAGSDMHMKSAEAHLMKNFYLPQKFVLFELAVPRPERRGAVLARRGAKQLVRQGAEIILFIKHIFLR